MKTRLILRLEPDAINNYEELIKAILLVLASIEQGLSGPDQILGRNGKFLGIWQLEFLK